MEVIELKTFYVPLEKSYVRKRGNGYLTIQGYIPIEAGHQEDAKQLIKGMLNRWQKPCLQTCDPSIVWEEGPPGDGWEYADFSFGLAESEEAERSDGSVKPCWVGE